MSNFASTDRLQFSPVEDRVLDWCETLNLAYPGALIEIDEKQTEALFAELRSKTFSQRSAPIEFLPTIVQVVKAGRFGFNNKIQSATKAGDSNIELEWLDFESDRRKLLDRLEALSG